MKSVKFRELVGGASKTMQRARKQCCDRTVAAKVSVPSRGTGGKGLTFSQLLDNDCEL